MVSLPSCKIFRKHPDWINIFWWNNILSVWDYFLFLYLFQIDETIDWNSISKNLFESIAEVLLFGQLKHFSSNYSRNCALIVISIWAPTLHISLVAEVEWPLILTSSDCFNLFLFFRVIYLNICIYILHDRTFEPPKRVQIAILKFIVLE